MIRLSPPREVQGLPRAAVRGAARAALALALAIAQGACSPKRVEPLRVGLNAEPGYEFAYLAQVEGLFEREGVRVRLVEFGSMSDARAAYERGDLDAFFGTVLEVVQARARSGRSPRIVRVLDTSTGFDVVLARPGLDSVASLRGRRVAVEPGSVSLYVLARALERDRLSLADVALVEMDPTEMREAFERGHVDAAVSYPPASAVIEHAGLARAIFSSAEIPGEVVDVLAVDDAALHARGRDAAALLRAYDRAVQWAAAHPEEASRIMAAREQVPPAEFRDALERDLCLVPPDQQARYFGPDRLLARVVESTSRLLLQTGRIDRPVPAADVTPTDPVD